jgi:hypothetical protein
MRGQGTSVNAHLLEGSGGRIGGRRVLVAGEQSTTAEVDSIQVAQGEEVEGKVAGELRRLETKLTRGLWWSEEDCNGGSAVSSARRSWESGGGESCR